jgi:hypothetical protein
MSVTRFINKIGIPGMPQVIPILMVMMEVFWIYAWLIWISTIPTLGWRATPLNLVSCLALGVIVEVMVRTALSSRWSLTKVRWIIIPVSLLVLFFLIRLNLTGSAQIWNLNWFNYIARETSELVTASIFGIVIIWRGISAAQQDNSFSGLYHRFIFGLVAIILVLILWRFGISQITNIWQSIGLEVLFFFGCGLLAMAISNLERLRVELTQHQEATTSFSRRWVSMLILLVVAILVIGIVMTGLLSQDTGSTIVHFLGNLGHWLLTGLLYLLYPVGFVGQLLFWIAKWILALIRREPPPPLDPNSLGGNLPESWAKEGEGALPEALIQALKWGSILIVSGLVVFFLSRLLARYWKVKSEEGVEEVNETLGSWNLLKMDLRTFLGWLFRWLRRGKPAQIEDEAQFRSPALEGDAEKLYTIREIYQALLWEGRQNGTPRRTYETPHEYNRRLQEQRENVTEELNTLTEAYVVERYGHINPAPDNVSWLNRVWRSLRDKFRNKESDL